MIDLLKQLGVAVLYALLAKIVLTFFSANGVVSIVCPSSGLALAVLLIGGKRYFWGIFLGALLANAMTGIALATAAAIAAGNTLEALIGAWLLGRSNRFDKALQSLRSYLLLILAGSIGSSVTALNGTTVLLLSGFLTSETYLANLRHWWMGDALGIALITPLILIYWQSKNDWPGAKRVAEAALLLGLTFLAGQIIFLDWLHASIGQVAKGYLMFLFITWVAIRLGTHGTVIALAVTATQAVLGAYHRIGYFANVIAQNQFDHYWLYMMILSGVGMALATFTTAKNQANEVLREGEEFFRMIAENIHDFIAVIDLEGRRLYNNAAYTKLLNGTENLKGTYSFAEVHPDDRERIKQIFLGTIRFDSSPNTAYRFVRPDGAIREMESSSKLIRDSRGKPSRVVVVSHDITERKQAEMALKASESRLQEIINVMPVALFVKNSAGNIILMNRVCEDQWGMSFSDLRGTDASQFFPPEQMALFLAKDREVFANRQQVDFEETTWSASRRENRIMHTYKKPVFDSDGNPLYLIGMSIDITECKATEQRLHDLSSHLLEVREEERARIAREIHDDLGGTLAALKMDAYWLSRKLPVNEETAVHIERIKLMSQRIDNAVSVTRRVISDLRPSILDDLGLLSALEWQAAEFHERTGIECTVNCIEDEANLDNQCSIALFRILQEALTNVSQHSGASKVEIDFRHSENEVILIVADNGCGIPADHMAISKSYGSKSYGILGMTERANQLGGKIIFSSPQGGGFTVEVELPLPARERCVR